MKSIIPFFTLIFIFYFSTISYSQQDASPEINPEKMVEIIMYDSDEVIKKIKIKMDPKKAIIAKSISVYNNKIHEIKTFNFHTFSDIKSFVTKKINEAKLTNDYRSMGDVKIKMDEMLEPVRTKVTAQKNILNTAFEKELTAKQYKNWIKYQKRQLEKLKPKAPERSQTQYQPQSQRNGNRQGMNRRTY